MMRPLKVLLIDDDKNIRKMLEVVLTNLNCEAYVCSSKDEAIEQLSKKAWDFILTDLKLGEESGIDIVRKCKTLNPVPLVTVMTAFASFETAVSAIKEGAFDYLPKPFSALQLDHHLTKIRKFVALTDENNSLKKTTANSSSYFLGFGSPAMQRLNEFVEKVAPTEGTVLITGESGTGKTELAREIHRRSGRSSKLFAVVHCTNLVESLIESELFGHVKGAFTGATHDHVGKLESGKGGTLFLDEIGDLSLNGQSKLLRVLQDKVIERVGSNVSIPVDIRLIAATNKNLEELIQEKKFREDLYYRLSILETTLVPLRHRSEDIPVLVSKFLENSGVTLDLDILEKLNRYSWPGNVRELKNALERVIVLSKGRKARLDDLPQSLLAPKQSLNKNTGVPFQTLEELERAAIEQVLKSVENQEKAAEILGITTVTLWRKRKQYGLP